MLKCLVLIQVCDADNTRCFSTVQIFQISAQLFQSTSTKVQQFVLYCSVELQSDTYGHKRSIVDVRDQCSHVRNTDVQQETYSFFIITGFKSHVRDGITQLQEDQSSLIYQVICSWCHHYLDSSSGDLQRTQGVKLQLV